MLIGAQGIDGLSCPVVIEFWPYGLHRAGRLSGLAEALPSYSRLVDLEVSREDNIVERTTGDIAKVFDELLANEVADTAACTDLLLVS